MKINDNIKHKFNTTWTWLHEGCNDQATVEFGGQRVAGVLGRACSHYGPEATVDSNGHALRYMEYFNQFIAAMVDAEVPVVRPSRFRVFDMSRVVDESTLPGGSNNVEDRALSRVPLN